MHLGEIYIFNLVYGIVAKSLAFVVLVIYPVYKVLLSISMTVKAESISLNKTFNLLGNSLPKTATISFPLRLTE